MWDKFIPAVTVVDADAMWAGYIKNNEVLGASLRKRTAGACGMTELISKT